MKYLVILALSTVLAGCYTSQQRWTDFAEKNACSSTGAKKVLYAGSVYKMPQRRVVYEFQCQDQKVWSDLGNYARYNEWLEI